MNQESPYTNLWMPIIPFQSSALQPSLSCVQKTQAGLRTSLPHTIHKDSDARSGTVQVLLLRFISLILFKLHSRGRGWFESLRIGEGDSLQLLRDSVKDTNKAMNLKKKKYLTWCLFIGRDESLLRVEGCGGRCHSGCWPHLKYFFSKSFF